MSESPQNSPRSLASAAERKERIRNRVGVAILAITFAWAAAMVLWRTFGPRGEVPLSGKTVIRFAHWQLEAGVVNALEEAAEEYMSLHPDVIVKQIPVGERSYEQWVKTQLIGRTAPDLIELRTWKWHNLIVRYFTPLDDVIERPNPYNEGTELEGMAWKDTYIDNMRGGYVDRVQGHYGMPLSVFTIRCYANADLIAKATGTTKEKVRETLTGRRADGTASEPLTLGKLFAICREIEQYAQRTGRRDLVPIAGSQYTANMFRLKYWNMATWNLRDMLDRNCDGSVSDAERLEAIFTGRLDLTENACVRAGFEVLYRLSRFFQAGFLSTDRVGRVLLFTQGYAAMVATGTWDAKTFYKDVAGEFDIVIFDFPTAAPEEQYGRYLRHRVSEAGERAGFSFGLTQVSRHKETAIDFMHFLTSLKPRRPKTRPGRGRVDNEWLNRQFQWFPAIIGAGTDDILAHFRPKVVGIVGDTLTVHLGGDTELRYEQMYKSFIGEENPPGDHYENFIREYADVYEKYALRDFDRKWKNVYRSAVEVEAVLSQMRAQVLRSGAAAERLPIERKRTLVSAIYGQTRKIQGRFRDRKRVDDVARPLEGGR
jgi:raffinose/stachyose/melibiose transport system substrate-binding protein